MITYTAEINPQGRTTDERLNSLVSQLRIQNEQLKMALSDLQKQIKQNGGAT